MVADTAGVPPPKGKPGGEGGDNAGVGRSLYMLIHQNRVAVLTLGWLKSAFRQVSPLEGPAGTWQAVGKAKDEP